MKIPESYVVIYQPRYKVPNVFDLDARGTFTDRPSVSTTWGFRIVANVDLQVKLQVVQLMQTPGKDAKTGKHYDWVVESVIVDLDEALTPDPATLTQLLPDTKIRSAEMAGFNDWHDGFVPMSGGKIDRSELRKKLTAAVEESKTRIRSDLVRKNYQWVYSNILRRVDDFRYGLYNHVKDDLYHEYLKNGGEDSENNLIKKIALFNRVLENCGKRRL